MWCELCDSECAEIRSRYAEITAKTGIFKRGITCYHMITTMVYEGDDLGQTELEPIRSFLLDCKNHIENGRFEFVERRKCLRTLTELEMSIDDVERVVSSLQPSNYIKGPESDHDAEKGGDIYIFGADTGGIELYIKLKCDEQRGCVCISFHRAEWPLIYPYREG